MLLCEYQKDSHASEWVLRCSQSNQIIRVCSLVQCWGWVITTHSLLYCLFFFESKWIRCGVAWYSAGAIWWSFKHFYKHEELFAPIIYTTGSHPVWAGGIERWCRRAVDSTYPCRNYTNIYDRNSLARVKKDTSDVGYILFSMISYLRYCVCISNLIHVSRHNTHHSTIASVQKRDDAQRESQLTRWRQRS